MTTGPLSVEDKIEKGKLLKEQGNAEFKAGKNVEALRFYHQATLFLTGLDNGNALSSMVPSAVLAETAKKDITDTLRACYLNMAGELAWKRAAGAFGDLAR
ncbi:hypothetical protein BDK51DRAFT_44661 [Blyttiomyces helicus]|uniref:Uncharacterized protein n=1 Tax=Blyttiomyces helicus TaxID=388810 RepID=A0A4P9WBK7_9FUNG|nr:hypothetical protein BDK51DRAFT_44661 [Blyttiomyces helicus]|eukprot:RKO88300.1 hypothetical protein BDK51DRAFT_44661 [Blyttiomyces helicus]